jgi:aspartyl-tRNA(Asn)/glutamyl-tRNA(Gln) amidotransferase subunit A
MIDFDALDAANAPLNAFVDWDRDASFGDGPLAGVTVGAKANIMVAGLPWTCGSALHRDRIAARDAETVARLRSAGAAIIGSQNMEEGALGAKTDNPWFGPTHNPHRIGFSPGGSSGGSGAAVAAGLCDVALGTDTMGSIRIPAAYCGVYGFKPAHSAVSQDGLDMTLPSMDTIGPIARDLDMLERAARAMSDFGEEDCGAVVTLTGDGGVEPTDDVARIFADACDKAGATPLLTLPHPMPRVRFAGFIAASRWLAAHHEHSDRALLSPAFAKLLTYGPRRSADDLAADAAVLDETRHALLAGLGGDGVLILPTAPQAAFAHSDPAPANQADYCCLANVAGLPALSIPAGWSADGLPIGIQLIGRAAHEAGLFALARRLDKMLGAYRPPPNFGY